MPDVNIIGDISYAVSTIDAVSLTWAIVPGKSPQPKSFFVYLIFFQETMLGTCEMV